jgi:hypothetical protein
MTREEAELTTKFTKDTTGRIRYAAAHRAPAHNAPAHNAPARDFGGSSFAYFAVISLATFASRGVAA